MVSAAFALINWIPELAQAASEPVMLAIWGGALFVLGASLRARYARRSTSNRTGSRLVGTNVAQPVEG
jgi:hypothetical protein